MLRSTALLLSLLGACGSPAKTPAPAQAAPASAPAPAPQPEAPFVTTPTAKPPPPPDGAALIEPALYVQRCDAAHPCPELLQAAGETHCRELRLGEMAHWRLPDRAEVQRFATGVGMEKLEGFHWTRTPFEQDGSQVWIVDPKTGQETTIPRTRKPFTIRCVLEP